MNNYYVSAIEDSRKAFLAGPYQTHQEALDKVEEVRRIANERSYRAAFWAFGTAGSDKEFKTALGMI